MLLGVGQSLYILVIATFQFADGIQIALRHLHFGLTLEFVSQQSLMHHVSGGCLQRSDAGDFCIQALANAGDFLINLQHLGMLVGIFIKIIDALGFQGSQLLLQSSNNIIVSNAGSIIL